MFLRYKALAQGMSKSYMTQITTYVYPNDVKKIVKKRGERGFISDSAYLRFLLEQDIGKDYTS